MNKVAIIGAGLCGAAAAVKLMQAGYEVTIFDKGRSAGGRMSSKRTKSGYLDMGAQYFTARDPGFQQQVQRWLDAGCAQQWLCKTAALQSDGASTTLQASPDKQLRYIGTPSMQSPVKFMLADVPVNTGCRIIRLQHDDAKWALISEDGERYCDFDDIVLTMPPVQTEQLMAQSDMAGLFVAPSSVLEPCWAVAMRAEDPVQGDAIFCEHPRLRFVSHQGSKPGRQSCYILHFNAAFSRANLEQPTDFWFDQARSILADELGVESAIEPLVAHRWMYASQNAQWTPGGLIALAEHQLWIGGDWSYGGRVENAYLSGLGLASALVSHRAGFTASQ